MYQTSADFVQQMDRRPFQVLLTGAQGSAAVDTLEYSAAWCPSAFTLGATGGAGFTAALHGPDRPLSGRGAGVADRPAGVGRRGNGK